MKHVYYPLQTKQREGEEARSDTEHSSRAWLMALVVDSQLLT